MFMRSVYASIVVATLLVSGCASVPDLSGKDGACVRECSTAYSQCLSKFSIFPLERQHECTSSLQLCGDSCPAKAK